MRMPDLANIRVVAPGGANTDGLISNTRLPGRAETVVQGELDFGPGGKSRNAAQVAAYLLGPGTVGFSGLTLEQPDSYDGLSAREQVAYALARFPIEALDDAGVVTEYIAKGPFEGTFAGFAAIPIERLAEGGTENMIVVAPGLNASYGPEHVDFADPLFEAARGNGVVPLALEVEKPVLLYVVDKASQYGLKVMADLGGINPDDDWDDLLSRVDILGGNEVEARGLTGIEVKDDRSATKAARALYDRYGVEHVLVTRGADGICYFTGGGAAHIPALDLGRAGLEAVDPTAAGDTLNAVVAAGVIDGRKLDIETLIGAAVGGALQASKIGVQPVRADEISQYRNVYADQTGM